MKYIIGISLDNTENIEYYFTSKLELKKGITVVVENSDNTLHLGYISTNIHPIDESKLHKNLGHIVRIATKKDYQKYQSNLKLAHQSLKRCRQLVKKYNLNMNIIDASFTLDQSQLLFSFYSDNRVDFRDLARDLAAIYKTRIELHQIGVRDKAKKVGGVGICGQKLCCSRFINEFDSVSISMAKNQNLSLNPNKINGVCGRLLCCLKYENCCYKELKKKLPQVGQVVELESVKGKVVSVDVLRQSYEIENMNKEIIKIHEQS